MTRRKTSPLGIGKTTRALSVVETGVDVSLFMIRIYWDDHGMSDTLL